MIDFIKQELLEAQATLTRFVEDSQQMAQIAQAAHIMVQALQAGKKILSCGNGGSHCDAMHFAEELTGKYRAHRPAIAAIAIADPSHLSCVGNDYGFDFVFARYIEALGQPGDVLLAISTSGNSANVLKAIEAARQKEMKVVLLSGKEGGKMKGLGDAEVIVAHQGFADRIQEVHIKVIHILMGLIEQGLGYTSPQ